MINVEYYGSTFKIYACGKITSPNATNLEIKILKSLVDIIMSDYHNPYDGFPVSFLASRLPRYNVKVISYRDYEMENAPEDRIY